MRLPLLLPLLLLLLHPHFSLSLNLASRCLSSFAPGECPCSQRNSPALDFCLTAAAGSTCRQHTCASRYICDCSGDTLCRTAPIRTTLTCRSTVLADGTCQCDRIPIRTAGLATQLVPLRPHRPLHEVRAIMPRNKVFCSERPVFWTGYNAETFLTEHWKIAAEKHRDAPVTSLPLIRYGHPGHAISFTTPAAVTRALTKLASVSRIDGEIVDPVNHQSVNLMTAECVAALLSIKLASQGVATRPNAAVVPFDMANRMILQPCAYLPKSNPAVGMSLERVMERAMLATGEFPIDDATMSHDDVAQACSAINRNFEACQVDVGCFAVTA